MRVPQKQVDVATEHQKKVDEAIGRFNRLRFDLGAWLVGQALGEQTNFGQFERELSAHLMELGCAACDLFLAMSWSEPTRKAKDARGLNYDYAGEKPVTVRTSFGVFSTQMSVYHRSQGKTRASKVLVPELSAVGLLSWGGGLSPNVALDTVELATRMPFEHVREVQGRFRGYTPSGRSICGLIDLLGSMGAEALSGVSLEDGEVVMLFADGRGLPIIRPSEYAKRCKPHEKLGREKGRRRVQQTRSSKPRRTKGQKAKKKKRVTVGLIMTLRRTEDGEGWEVMSKKVVANRGGAEPVFQQLARDLKSLGPGERDVYFLSDGDPHLERLQKLHLPEARSVVDLYHVCEYLWMAGETLHKEGSQELVMFVRELKHMLLDDRPDEVIERLKAAQQTIPKRGPGTKGRRKRMADAIRYLTNRKPRLSYRQLLERGLEIGSGAIESAIRQVVAIRFDGPGMRWGQRAQHLLSLLCLRLSGGWPRLQLELEQRAQAPHPQRRITPRGVNERSGAARRKALKLQDNKKSAA